MLKIIRDLIQPDLCYIELDGRKVGTIYAFEGWHDRIREALEGREATPEESYLLEEQGREIATLVKRLANAELLIEKLKEEVGHWEEDFALFDRAHEKAIDLWRKEHPDAGYTPDMSDLNEWMVRRVERAEAVKDSLTSALGQFVEAYHKGLIGAVPDVPPAFAMDSPGHPPSPFITRNLLEEMVRKAEAALRTAEETNHGTHDREERAADSYLITAAPEMLKALGGAKWLIDSFVFNPAYYEEYQDVCNAIKKARG